MERKPPPGCPSVVPTVSEGGSLTPGSRSRHRQGLLLATGRNQAWDLALLCLTGVQSCQLPQAPCPALPFPCPHPGGHCGLWLSHMPDLATLNPSFEDSSRNLQGDFSTPCGSWRWASAGGCWDEWGGGVAVAVPSGPAGLTGAAGTGAAAALYSGVRVSAGQWVSRLSWSRQSGDPRRQTPNSFQSV